MNYKRLFAYSRLCAQSIVIACMVIACQQEEQSEEVLGGYITFSPILDGEVVGDVSTRVEDIELKNFGFTVCGYESENSKFDAVARNTYPNVFKGKSEGSGQHFQKVKYELDDVDRKQKFITKERPWVVAEENYLSFFAWSDNVPDAADNGITGHSPATQTGYPTITIGVTDEITKHPDIVISRAIDLRNNALISAVDLQFKHLLSKISFKAYSSSGTSVKITSFNIKYGGTTYRKATYDLDPNNDLPFTFTNAVTNKHGTGSYPIIATGTLPDVNGTDNVSPATAIMLGNMMQIPQDTPDDFLTAEITYQIKGSDNAAGPEITRNIPIKAMKLQQGFHYIFAFDFISTEVQISVNSIADWNEMGDDRLPLVAGPKGDVLLWLDAGDAPYKFGSDEYWLDRSGYNRHCKIVRSTEVSATTIDYIPAEKVYRFAYKTKHPDLITSYVQLPDLATEGISPSEYTIQMLLRTDELGKVGYQVPFLYSNVPKPSSGSVSTGLKDREIMLVLYRVLDIPLPINNRPVGGVIFFDTDGDMKNGNESQYNRLTSEPFRLDQQNVFSLLTFQHDGRIKTIARNDNYEWNEPVGNSSLVHPASLRYGYLGGDFAGDFKMVKILKRKVARTEIEKDFSYYKKLHKIPNDKVIPTGQLPTNKDGLIAYFNAFDAPYQTTAYQTTRYYWRDRTGNGNDLRLNGYDPAKKNSGIVYDANNKCYQFFGDRADTYMQFTQIFGALNDYTIEFNVYNDGAGSTYPSVGTTERVLLHFSAVDGVTDSKEGFMWYFPNKNNNLWAYGNDIVCKFDDAPSSKTWSNIWGISRSGTKLSLVRSSDNNRFSSAVEEIGTRVPKLNQAYIGIDASKKLPFKGRIKRIRVYNRSITNDERSAMRNEMLNGMN